MKNKIIRRLSSSYKFSGGGVLLLFSLCVVMLFSCRKKIVTDTTLERTSALGEKFRSVLASSPQGWLVCIENRQGLHYNFYMQFMEEGRVKMKADFNAESLNLQESSYAIKLLQQPTLSFNTYNYISTLSDPDLGSPRGRGLRTDFEYALTAEFVEHLQSSVSVTEIKHFTLRGVLYQSKITFKRVNNASDNKLIDEIIQTEKLLSSLKYGTAKTLTVLSLGSSDGTEYHYDFRPNGKLFALTSLSSGKKGAPMNYYFDICGEGGLKMRFVSNKSTTLIKQFVDGNLANRFEKMAFSNFNGGTDTTTITFSYSDGKNTAQSGTLTTKDILTTSPLELASITDSARFISNINFQLIDIVEAGTSWDLSNRGTVVYGNPGRRTTIKFRSRLGANVKTYILDFLHSRTRARVGQIWTMFHSSIKPNGKSYYMIYINPFRTNKYRLDNFRSGFAHYTGRDTSLYLSTENKQRIIDKVYLNTTSAPIDWATTNVFFLFATTMGYQLHNISKRVVIQYDL